MSEQQNPAFPPQHQDRQPGLESEMTPRPHSEAKSYKAAGKLAGKVAIVSGGDSGIGKAVAIAFAKEGADVAVLYKDEHGDAEQVKTLVEAEGRRCLAIAGDVGDEAAVRDAVERVVREFGRLDVVVPNAAEQHVNDDFATLETAQFEQTFRTNVFGTFFLIREGLKHLKEGGTIVVTTSVTAFRGSPELVDYSATKGAQLAMVRALANQLASKGVRVNAVAPGPIWTPLIPASFDDEKLKDFGRSTKMGRAGQPDEVAPCYVFLAGPDSSYMTGQVLHPNGGEIVA
jgi:NAD(P)-dependent dehydrogenase (short-subunit alcohol dehydrogenase family)